MTSPTEHTPPHAGLCATCQHARTVESAKGSLFLLCDAHRTHPELPKYPRLPVLACPAYTERETQT